MSSRFQTLVFWPAKVWVALLCCITLPTAFAGNGQHPMEGTVTAVGTSQDTSGGGGNIPVWTHVHRTYTVKTPARSFVLECPYGDSVRFRVEKTTPMC
jgi:hypothetical protein